MKCKKHSFSLNYKELGEILYFLSSSNYKSSLQNVSLKKKLKAQLSLVVKYYHNSNSNPFF